MTPRRRVVFHIASLRGGGAERVFVLMANELAARGHEVTLFTWNAEGPNAALVSDRVTLIDFGMPIRKEGYGKAATLRGLFRSAALFRQLQPDAVFSAPAFANLLVALALIMARSKAAFFPTFHAAAALQARELGARAANLLSQVVVRRAHKVVAVSAGIAGDLLAAGVNRDRIAVIHNPLPPPGRRLGEQDWRAALETADGPVIATAGRLVPVKDHRTLLHAFALLLKRRPARLVLFGEGPLEGELKAEAGRLGIADRVFFPGYVNDPAACYEGADLFVLTSRTEGFGNVLVEAMAAGVPVVSTDAPHGPREILADGVYGPLVPVGDAPALADAMGRLLERPTPEALLARRAADFSIEVIGGHYEALLAGIDPEAGGRGARRAQGSASTQSLTQT